MTGTEARRHAERERTAAAVRALLTADGWRRWATTRARFRPYSLTNQLLIAAQCPHATRVAGYRAWQALGRQVARGARGIRIHAPVTRTATDARTGEQTRALGYVTVSVFDISQTSGEPLPEMPGEPVTGESHAHLLPRLDILAATLGYAVRFGDVPGEAEGTCDHHARVITVRADRPVNARVAILAHELAHALGATYTDYPRHEAEVIAETAAHIALAAAGLDTAGESIPYLASWAERDPAAMERTAHACHAIAARLEEALDLEPAHAPPSPQGDGLTLPATPTAHRPPPAPDPATPLHTLCPSRPGCPLW